MSRVGFEIRNSKRDVRWEVGTRDIVLCLGSAPLLLLFIAFIRWGLGEKIGEDREGDGGVRGILDIGTAPSPR